MRGRPVTISEDDILNAARDVYLLRGLDATTTEIAQRAGVSESIIFYRYKTKEALFLAVIDRQLVVPKALETLKSRVGQGDIAEHLYEVGTAILDMSQTVLPLMMQAWSSPAKLALMHERMQHPNPVQLTMIRLLSGYFEAESRLGRIRAVDPEVAARAFLGGMSEYVMSQCLHRTTDSLPLAAPTYLRGLINILFEGLRPPKIAQPAPRTRR
jgi:AcrR family transcriptional regulator